MNYQELSDELSAGDKHKLDGRFPKPKDEIRVFITVTAEAQLSRLNSGAWGREESYKLNKENS